MALQNVIRWASYLQKVRIQFLFALRKGNELTEKSMKHIHTGTRARRHILMQPYTLNVTDEKLSIDHNEEMKFKEHKYKLQF